MAEASLTPEVLALLEELAHDPRAALLRVEPHRALRAALHREPPAGLSMPGLTALERHLLRAHRAELAFAMRQACVMKIHSSRSTWYRPVEWYRADKKIDIPTWERWRARAEELSSVPTDDSEASLGMALLGRCVAPDEFAEASISQLAAASMRLEPTDQARVYVGQDLMLGANGSRALEVLGALTAGGASSSVASHAWCNAGFSHARMGDLDSALLAHQESIDLDDQNIAHWIGLIGCCVLRNDGNAVVENGMELDRRAATAQEAVSACIAAIGSQEPSRATGHSERIARLEHSVSSRIGPVTQEVVSAYF